VRLARWCAVVLMSLVAGCHGDQNRAGPPSAPGFPNWPKTLSDFRFRWSAEPGIDLLSGAAVPLRAYLESYRVADFTLDPNAVYPGFQRAVPQGVVGADAPPDVPYQLWYIRPSPAHPEFGFDTAWQFGGNEYFHVLELTAIDTGYRAYVCDGLYKVFLGRNGKYVPLIGRGQYDEWTETNAVDVWRVEFTGQPSASDIKAPPVVGVAQKGPNPAPLGDVFGPWRITGASETGYWGPLAHPESNSRDEANKQRHQQCFDRMPDDAAQRRALLTGIRDAPPPAEPAVPGWPQDAL